VTGFVPERALGGTVDSQRSIPDGPVACKHFNQDLDRDPQSRRDAGGVVRANDRCRDRIDGRRRQLPGAATGGSPDAAVNAENKLLDKKMKGICRGC